MWVKYIAVGLLVILIVFRLFSKSSETAFGSLGLVSGLALGLSASPVLAATITAVFTLAGVLVPIYLRTSKSAESEGHQAGDPQRWLGPLARWLAVGLVVGIFLRTNDALNFSVNLRNRYHAQGFDKAQIDSIMSAHAVTLAKQTPEPTSVQSQTNLQSQERREKWATLVADNIRPSDTPEKNLERIKNAVSADDLERVRVLEKRGTSATQILEELKSWH